MRPTKSAGATDGFRQMNVETFQMPADVALEGIQKRQQYVDALRDWVKNGDLSPFALSAEEAGARV